MSRANLIIGRLGEELALEYLIRKKYCVRQLNYFSKNGEIDIIVFKNKKIIFVEVKARTNNKFGWPEESFNQKKQIKFIETINDYLSKQKNIYDWQIDLITLEIDLKNSRARLRHYQAIDLGCFQ